MKTNELIKKATDEEIAILLQKLRYSFAHRSDMFFSVMSGEIIDSGYNNLQLKRAVKNIIRECSYNELSISTVLKACDKESPYRTVEYERLRTNGTWERVALSEKVYNEDMAMYRDGEKPKFIRFIED